MTAPRRVLLATRSAHKAREIRDILAPLELVTLDDIGLPHTPDEDGVEAFDTFLENARAKAAFFVSRTGMAALADDSGISVHALNNRPGVRSRRYAAAPGLDGDVLDQANNRKLLQELGDVPAADRTAHYTCAAVLLLPEGASASAIATCSGVILHEPRGNGGFGYDPLFLIPDLGVTFAEMDAAEKNRRSHRARAFRALAPCTLRLLQPHR